MQQYIATNVDNISFKVWIKDNIVPVTDLIKHYAMKTYWGVDVQIHNFLPSALAGGVVSFTPGRFTPGDTAPGTHWIRDWMGPRVGLDVEKILDSTGIELPTPQSSSP
jgi:hypothetical protein